MTSGRELIVSINREPIGRVYERNNLWAFEYSDQWLSRHDRFDISPALPCVKGQILDGGTDRPVQWFFDNLLPEESARMLLAKDAGVNGGDAFALLSYYGAESAGALTLLPPGEAGDASDNMSPLSPALLAARIGGLPGVSLSASAPKRMSLAGAQHKLAVIFKDGALFDPIGHTASSHILKPEHSQPDVYYQSVVNEWFVMQLAKRLQLPVPVVHIDHIPDPIYLIERFDRQAVDGALLRKHTLDACQLLSIDRAFKYSNCTMDTLQRLVQLTRRKTSTRVNLFRWVLFNLFTGNGDAHLKNLSFFVGNEGVSLTPHYDLICTSVYVGEGLWGEAELSWGMGSARLFGEVRKSHVLEFGQELGLPVRQIDRILAEFSREISNKAGEIISGVEALGERHASRAGELRLIRLIRFGVIEDMLRQLG